MTPARSALQVGEFLASRIVAFGRVPELTASELKVERCAPGAIVPKALPVAAVILDARDHPLAELLAARRAAGLAVAPAVVIAGSDRAEAAGDLSAADADDVIVLPVRNGELVRRVRVVVALGRARLAASFAELALAHGVTGVTIADVLAADQPIVWANQEFERITGYRREDIIGNNCRVLQRDDRDQAGIAVLRAAVRARTRASAVLRNYRADGTPFWNEVTIFPVVVNGEDTPWVAGVQHDVTELLEARARNEALDRQLLEQTRFDHAILDGVDLGIVTTDVDGRALFVNQTARELLGVEDGAALRDVRELLGLDGTPEQILAGEARRSLAHTTRLRDGDELSLDLTVSRGDGKADERIGFFYIFRDATAERRGQEERRRLERLAAMGTMVAGFAHEVRNPVAALRSICEELGEDLTASGRNVPHVARMLQLLDRIERLVRTSLLFGRPAAPRRGRHRPWVLVSAALVHTGPRLRDGGSVVIEVEPDLPDVYVDDGQIVQVLVALLNNAIDSVCSAKRIQVCASLVRSDGDGRQQPSRRSEPPPPAMPYVRYDVTDDGAGITASRIGRVFDPFFTTKPSGTGLGLSIAQQLVADNGGRIQVTSTPGVVTTFSVILPCATD